MVTRIGRNLLIAFLLAVVAFVGLNVFTDGNIVMAAGPVCAIPSYDPPAEGGKGDVHIEWTAPEAKGDLFVVLVKFAKGMTEQEILDIAYRQELYISRSGGNVYGRSSVDTGRYAIVTHHKNVWGVDGLIEVHPNQQNMPLCWGNPTAAAVIEAPTVVPSPTPEPTVMAKKEVAAPVVVEKEVVAPDHPLADYLKDIAVSVAQPITYTGTFTLTDVHTMTGRAEVRVPIAPGTEALMFFDIGLKVEPRKGAKDGVTAIVETAGAVLVDQAIRVTTNKDTVWPDIWYSVYGSNAEPPTLEDAYNLSRNGGLKLSNGSIEAVAGKIMIFNVPFSFEVAAAEAVTVTAAATTGVIAAKAKTVTVVINEDTNTLYEAWTAAYGEAPTKAEWQKYAAENDIPLSETTGNPIVRLGQELTFEVPATAAP